MLISVRGMWSCAEMSFANLLPALPVGNLAVNSFGVPNSASVKKIWSQKKFSFRNLCAILSRKRVEQYLGMSRRLLTWPHSTSNQGSVPLDSTYTWWRPIVPDRHRRHPPQVVQNGAVPEHRPPTLPLPLPHTYPYTHLPISIHAQINTDHVQFKNSCISDFLRISFSYHLYLLPTEHTLLVWLVCFS